MESGRGQGNEGDRWKVGEEKVMRGIGGEWERGRQGEGDRWKVGEEKAMRL